MTNRTFGSIDPARNRREKEQFTLQGLYEFDVKDRRTGDVVHVEGEEWSETFTCLRNPPAGVLDDLVASVGYDDRGNERYDRLSIVRFLRGVVVPDDEDRLNDVLRDKARPLDLQDDVGPLFLDLCKRLGGRPTTPPSS
jgi:hypothetical protein